MDWLARMNGALDYIEDHLGGEIDYRALAAQAGCSPFHLQRTSTAKRKSSSASRP